MNSEIKKQIESINQRNKSVEIDKAWEVSVTRRVIIFILTYLVIVVFLFLVNLPNPWINALVPSVGFMLSTLSLPYFKRLWIKFYYKK